METGPGRQLEGYAAAMDERDSQALDLLLGTPQGPVSVGAVLAATKGLLAAVEVAHTLLDHPPVTFDLEPDDGAVDQPVAAAELDAARAVVATIGHIDAALTALRARVLAGADTRGIPSADGATSTAAWLSQRTRLSRRSAFQESRQAVELTGQPDLLASLRDGEVSADHAREVLAALRRQGAAQDAARRAREEEASRREQQKRAREEEALRRAADEAERARLRQQAERRRARDAQRRERERVRRAAQDEAAATQQARRLTDAARTGDTPETLRRDADARRRGDARDDEMAHSEAAKRQNRSARWWHDPETGMPKWLIQATDLDHELMVAVADAFDAPDPEDTPPDARRTPEQRRYDALVEALHRLSRANLRIDSSGRRAVIVTTTTSSELLGELTADGGPRVPGIGRFGTPMSRQTLQQLACDASFARLLTDDEGHLLAVGRAERSWNVTQRRFIEARDRGCAFPGCDRPPAWCDIHHIVFWSDGGFTDVDNGVLLCRRHHTAVHHEGWTLSLDPPTGTVTASRQLPGAPPDVRTRQVAPSHAQALARPRR